MSDTTLVTLTVEEIAIAKTAIRAIRIMTAVGVAIAIPMLLVLALPVLSYALVAAVFAAPIVIGVSFYKAGRQNVPQAS